MSASARNAKAASDRAEREQDEEYHTTKPPHVAIIVGSTPDHEPLPQAGQ